MPVEQLLRDKCPSCGDMIILHPSPYFKGRVFGYCKKCNPLGAIVEKDAKDVKPLAEKPRKPFTLSDKDNK